MALPSLDIIIPPPGCSWDDDEGDQVTDSQFRELANRPVLHRKWFIMSALCGWVAIILGVCLLALIAIKAAI